MNARWCTGVAAEITITKNGIRFAGMKNKINRISQPDDEIIQRRFWGRTNLVFSSSLFKWGLCVWCFFLWIRCHWHDAILIQFLFFFSILILEAWREKLILHLRIGCCCQRGESNNRLLRISLFVSQRQFPGAWIRIMEKKSFLFFWRGNPEFEFGSLTDWKRYLSGCLFSVRKDLMG